MKKIPKTSFHLFFVAFLAGFAGCGSRSGQSAEEMEVNSSTARREVKAPSFSLTDLKGQKFNLDDFKGKVVFLDFWATWCPPCVMSVPEVVKLNNEYHAQGVEVISLSLDQKESAVRDFVIRHNMTNRVALVGSSRVADDYEVEGIPAFYVIDQKGNVVRAWGGYSRMMPSVWRKELDRLLKV